MPADAFGFGGGAMPAGMRSTTQGGPGPQQVGGAGAMSGLAPWLTQGAPSQPFQFNLPKMGTGQQDVLAQQQALAAQLRNQKPTQTLEQWKNPTGTFGPLAPYAPPANTPAGGFAPPTQEGVPSSSPDALNPTYQDATYGGHTDYSGEVPTFVQGPVNPTDPYGFGPDYSDFYNKAHGAGSYDAEAARYSGLDASNQLGDYETLYGEFPENDPTAMEEWFRRAGTGGTQTAVQQSTIAQNRRTDMTEAGIMAALSMGMGALTGPAAAASMAGAAEEAAALGIGNAYAGASGAGAAGGGLLGAMTPSYWQTTNAVGQAAFSNPYDQSYSGGY